MAQAPGGSDVRSLVITGKSAAADGIAVLTRARPGGGRRESGVRSINR
jgi:hypothetical protein